MATPGGSTDPRARRGVPERVLLPPAPREPQLARRWQALPFDQRRHLAMASIRGPGPDDDLTLVAALARARVVTGWRLQVAALVLGWLMLMTLWGFGRSTFPEQEPQWLIAGLVAGGLVWLAAAVAATRRVGRARCVLEGTDGR